MNKISNFFVELKQKHVLIFSVILIIGIKLLNMAIKLILSALGIKFGHTNFDYMLSEILLLATILFTAALCRQTQILHCRAKGLFKGLWSGMIFFVLAVIGFLRFTVIITAQGDTYKSTPEIIAFLLFVLLVGLAEEILFRGIIADSILACFGKNIRGIWLSVFLGGTFFGLSHITNILSGQSVEESIIQAICVSMTGMLLTAIYVRHKNIYAVAILHATLDFFTMLENGLLADYSIAPTAADIDFWPTLRQGLISQSIFLIVAVFVLRPKILKKLIL